jgi:hypothetical protein
MLYVLCLNNISLSGLRANLQPINMFWCMKNQLKLDFRIQNINFGLVTIAFWNYLWISRHVWISSILCVWVWVWRWLHWYGELLILSLFLTSSDPYELITFTCWSLSCVDQCYELLILTSCYYFGLITFTIDFYCELFMFTR